MSYRPTLDECDLEHLEYIDRMYLTDKFAAAGLVAAAVAEIRHYRAVTAKLREHASTTPPGFGATKKAIELCISLLEGSRWPR